MRRSAPVLLALLALAACRDEPSVAEQFNTLASEVENKAREYEAGAENLVAEQERRLSNEADALLRQNADLLGNESVNSSVDVNSQ
jgi:predicted trehalose synthase